MVAQESPAAPVGWAEVIAGGGPMGLVILAILAAMSVYSVYLVIDHWLSFRRREVLPSGLTKTVATAIAGGRIAEADAACRSAPSILSEVIGAGLMQAQYGYAEVERAVENELVDQSAAAARRVGPLAMIANLAPMLGLLGTVTGMILAFREVAGSGGAAGADELAGGIYQALVTTVAGLLVAIPALAAHGVLSSRVDAMMSRVAAAAERAFSPMRRAAMSPNPPSP